MERYTQVKYRVDKATRELDKEYPSLFRHSEFKKLRKLPDWQLLTKYIVFLYDKKTELAIEFQTDLTARKDAAAMDAGFLKVNGHWPKNVKDLFSIEDQTVHAAIMCYLRDQNNHIWTNIVTTEQELEEFQSLRMKAIKRGKETEDKDIFEAAKKKDLLMEACDTRVKALKGYYLEFYGDHVDVQEREFEEMITPENAERILATMEKPWEEVREPVT